MKKYQAIPNAVKEELIKRRDLVATVEIQMELDASQSNLAIPIGH